MKFFECGKTERVCVSEFVKWSDTCTDNTREVKLLRKRPRGTQRENERERDRNEGENETDNREREREREIFVPDKHK